MRNKPNGFTLIELLISVAIIGLLAAIAIPNVLWAVQRSKQRRTMADMRAVATAWEARSADYSRYNAAGSVDGVSVPVAVDVLANALQPLYIKAMPQKDAWGHPYLFLTDQSFGSATPATKYVIVSGGHDEIISPEITTGAFTNFDCDIIYSNGAFLSFPEGFGQSSH